MYIEELETESGRWCQACVGFPYVGPVSNVSETVSTALGTCGFVEDLQLALRIAVDAESRLARCAIFTGPASQREALRRFIASLTKTELAAPGSIETASNAESFDNLMQPFPDNQLRTVPSDLRRGAVSFAAQFRVSPTLDQLFLESRALGHAVSYQMNATHAGRIVENVRAARHNLLAMRGLPGLSPSLLSMQERLTQALSTGAFWVEEHVGTSTKESLLAASQALRRHFQASCPEIKPPLVFSRGRFPDLVAAGLHSSTRVAPQFDEACAMAATMADVAALLSWHPGPVLAGALRRPARPPDAAVSARASPGPDPRAHGLDVYTGERPFIFVSYRSDDFQAILPFLQQLQQSGLRVWMDSGIPGSAEWTQVLEERISKCAILLLFLSQSAVDSKYVRREVLMADALNKPILTVRMGEPELRWGLKLVLSQYQMVQLGSQRLPHVVQNALRMHYPHQALD